jgi:hypothetical protein
MHSYLCPRPSSEHAERYMSVQSNRSAWTQPAPSAEGAPLPIARVPSATDLWLWEQRPSVLTRARVSGVAGSSSSATGMSVDQMKLLQMMLPLLNAIQKKTAEANGDAGQPLDGNGAT